MKNVLILAQIVLALSVAYVWVFRYDNVVKEFKQFGLSDLARNFVGVSKIALATLLIAGIWYVALVQISAAIMGLFMIAAQYFHFKTQNPFGRRLPSLILLALCVFIVLGATL